MKIFIIDDEKNICRSLMDILEDEGYQVKTCNTGREGLLTFEEFEPHAVILDVKLPDISGIEILGRIKKSDPSVPVIMISGNSNISDAVKAIKIGAFDFLEKPLSLPKVKITIKKALEFQALNRQMLSLQEQYLLDWAMIGESAAMQELKIIIAKIAPSNAKILIQGESGTGKELVARLIHAHSERVQKPFVKFNSAAIPRELVESELFGYERGAFTGADKRKKGKLEEADGGSLFLDEIGDMDLAAQAKILRVIQEGEFERVGGNETRRIDVRVIAATNKDLPGMVSTGAFREDLFYRLNVVPVFTPPLRDRKDDIPLILNHFSRIIAGELKVKEKTFNPKTIELLQKPDYPGNVRELRNIIERIYLLCDSKTPDPSDINALLFAGVNSSSPGNDPFWNQPASFADKKREFELRYLGAQLRLHKGSVSKTAAALELQQSNLSRKLHELGILQ
ncbi:MAG: sigma-54 dependent transcriptional regulator [Candidatus Cloacimonadaceae bacterium]|nr:sigma-54 dependent transcriptional regulator [Candidatus Cloacimonadaceae bacterium]